jgi:hypothetical protein
VTDELHAVHGILGAHPLRREHLLPDHDWRVGLLLRGLHRDLAGADRGDHVGARRRDVDHAEPGRCRLAQRHRPVLAAVHLLAVLGLAHPLHELAHRKVERDVLVRS